MAATAASDVQNATSRRVLHPVVWECAGCGDTVRAPQSFGASVRRIQNRDHVCPQLTLFEGA